MLREIPDILTKEECELLINYAKPKLEECDVVDDNKEGNTEPDHRRTSTQCVFELSGLKRFTSLWKLKKKIENKISEITNLPIENQENPVILNYKVGQEYQPHWDYFHEGTAYWKGEQKYGGQRLDSIMIYLNDVEEGGETSYPHIGVNIIPETGKLIHHKNYHNGRELTKSLHGSVPVIKGEKWIIVCWIRERKWKHNPNA